MKGNPIYKAGDKVKFWFWERFDTTPYDAQLNELNASKIEKEGIIYIVDKFGTFDNPTDASYDIMVCNDNNSGHNCLYKHITEKCVKAFE